MKSWLSIVLIIIVCGLSAYIVVFETGWVIAKQETLPEVVEVSDIINKAKAYRKAGQPRKAIEILKNALQKKPYNFALTVELGRSYGANNDMDLAISAYEKASEIDPKHYMPYRLLGFIYFNHKKDRARAEKYLEKSLALNPDQPDVKRFLDNMKGQPVAMPKRPSIPTRHGRNPRQVAPIPSVPDPRPKLPKIPRPGGK